MANNYQATFQRIEIKYLLSDLQYRALRARLRGIAEADAYGKTPILNIYYDTPDYRLIRRSLEKPVYKEKLRLRSYGTPTDVSPAFIEIKKKYDGVVYKRRVGMAYGTARDYLNGKDAACAGAVAKAAGNAQIIGEIDYFRNFYPGLRPMMAISYDRVAMAGVEDPALRITFDEHIRYRTDRLDLRAGAAGTELLAPGQHLMELKVAGAVPLTLARIFSELHIAPCSFSKYGRGFEDMMRNQMIARSSASAA